MGATAFSRPQAAELMNYYVPLPFEQIKSMAEPYQKQSDTLGAMAKEYRYIYANSPHLKEHEDIWGYKNKEAYDEFNKYYDENNLDFNQAQGKFYDLATKVKYDPVIKKLGEDYSTITAGREALAKAKADKNLNPQAHNIRPESIAKYEIGPDGKLVTKEGTTSAVSYDRYVDNSEIQKRINDALGEYIKKGNTVRGGTIRPTGQRTETGQQIWVDEDGKKVDGVELYNLLRNIPMDMESLRELGQRAAYYGYKDSKGKQLGAEDLYDRFLQSTAGLNSWTDLEDSYHFGSVPKDGEGDGNSKRGGMFATDVPSNQTQEGTFSIDTYNTKREETYKGLTDAAKALRDIKAENGSGAVYETRLRDARNAYNKAEYAHKQIQREGEGLLTAANLNWKDMTDNLTETATNIVTNFEKNPQSKALNKYEAFKKLSEEEQVKAMEQGWNTSATEAAYLAAKNLLESGSIKTDLKQYLLKVPNINSKRVESILDNTLAVNLKGLNTAIKTNKDKLKEAEKNYNYTEKTYETYFEKGTLPEELMSQLFDNLNTANLVFYNSDSPTDKGVGLEKEGIAENWNKTGEGKRKISLTNKVSKSGNPLFKVVFGEGDKQQTKFVEIQDFDNAQITSIYQDILEKANKESNSVRKENLYQQASKFRALHTDMDLVKNLNNEFNYASNLTANGAPIEIPTSAGKLVIESRKDNTKDPGKFLNAYLVIGDNRKVWLNNPAKETFSTAGDFTGNIVNAFGRVLIGLENRTASKN